MDSLSDAAVDQDVQTNKEATPTTTREDMSLAVHELFKEIRGLIQDKYGA